MCKKKREELSNFYKFLNDNRGKDYLIDDRYEKVYFIDKKIRVKRKNILFFSHEMKRTGAPIVLLELAKVLIKKGYSIVVFSLEEGDLIKDFIELNIPVVVSKKLKDNQLVKKIDKKEKFYLDDIISDFNFSIFNTLTLFNYIKRYDNTNNKILWWIHEGTTILDIPELKELYPKYVSDNIKVRFVSKYCVDLFKERHLDYGNSILCYGVKYLKEYKNIEEVKNERLKIATIGSLTYRKGQKLLIDSIISSPTEINNKSEYYFIGVVPKNDKYVESIKNELVKMDKEIAFVHYVPEMKHEDLLNFMNGIDVLVIPSYDDPMPVVAAEAMMFKKIVVCSIGCGTASLIENSKNGFVFESGKYEELMKVIEQIHNNKDLDSIKENSYNTFINNYDYKVFKKNIKNTIKEIERR
jgi:glycosyltransferase involved in cell wall biosynthesis